MNVTGVLDRLARWQRERRPVHAILIDRGGSIASCIGHIIEIEDRQQIVKINATVGWGHLHQQTNGDVCSTLRVLPPQSRSGRR